MKQILETRTETHIRRLAQSMALVGLLTVFSPTLLQAATAPEAMKPNVAVAAAVTAGEEVLSVVTTTGNPGDALGKISALVEKTSGKKFKITVNVSSGAEEVLTLSATTAAQGGLLKKMSSLVDSGKGKAYKISVKIVRME